MKITIPRSVKGVTEALEGIGALITAKKWERAALVYAVTHRDPASRRDPTATSDSWIMTYTAFAELGIHGLSSVRIVAKYHDAWQTAVDEGFAKPASLRRTVELPDPKEHPFPPTGNGRGFADAFSPGATPAQKKAAAEELLADPTVREMLHDPVAGHTVRREIDEAVQDRINRARMQADVKQAGDPVVRRMDENISVLDLQRAINRFTQEVAGLLPKIGRVAASEIFWLNEAVERAEATVEELRFIRDHGEPRVDHELREMSS